MKKTVEPALREALGHSATEDDAEILQRWKDITSSVCKPCWELKYCPFGPLVEDFPLLPPTRGHATRHNEYLSECLQTGKVGDGSAITEEQKHYFEQSIADFDPDKYPEEIPIPIKDAACNIFGHMCPAFFTAEPFTETKDTRRTGRYIPRQVMLKVVRRDGQVCQECGKNVMDSELEFDHIIPDDKGGPVSVANLRVLCSKCNGRKSNSLDLILDPRPLSKHMTESDKTTEALEQDT